jgi:hypothetical protein
MFGRMKRMKKAARSLLLTVNGESEAVPFNSSAYSTVAHDLIVEAGLRRGLAEARNGEGRPAAESG